MPETRALTTEEYRTLQAIRDPHEYDDYLSSLWGFDVRTIELPEWRQRLKQRWIAKAHPE